MSMSMTGSSRNLRVHRKKHSTAIAIECSNCSKSNFTAARQLHLPIRANLTFIEPALPYIRLYNLRYKQVGVLPTVSRSLLPHKAGGLQSRCRRRTPYIKVVRVINGKSSTRTGQAANFIRPLSRRGLADGRQRRPRHPRTRCHPESPRTPRSRARRRGPP